MIGVEDKKLCDFKDKYGNSLQTLPKEYTSSELSTVSEQELKEIGYRINLVPPFQRDGSYYYYIYKLE
jgi:hypothetical protein